MHACECDCTQNKTHSDTCIAGEVHTTFAGLSEDPNHGNIIMENLII